MTPAQQQPFRCDHEYMIFLSDWVFENPARILGNLKRYGGYYNNQRRMLANRGREAREMGL